ncbi:Hsp70 family protein [Oricola nitratireducens]|uniref:Hsp70 family protein n=1 Tax=Oricola nitratireducens TaxID=2775868 RepID=UPI001867B1B0|nr:Hsp70 family protein [Oricola nitratireducens]
MNKTAIGVDFGTSNSTAAFIDGTTPVLVPLEDGKFDMPSTVFFDFEDGQRKYGRGAIEAYVGDTEGRFMRALKSILGTSLEDENTYINGTKVAFVDIIAGFIRSIRLKAEEFCGSEIDTVVAGRPVHFIDDDGGADRKAEQTLERIFRAAGFRNVAFQYEPIAAALDYERAVRTEEIALIADLGGGTSDFSVVRISPAGRNRADRGNDILSTGGVRVGGTDLDRLTSLDKVMPELGLNSRLNRDFGDGLITIPRHVFVSLSTWQKIHLLYDKAVMREVKDYLRLSESPHLIERLSHVLHERLGHRLALAVEAAKIDLTDAPATEIDLEAVERGLRVGIDRAGFDDIIGRETRAIQQAMRTAIGDAGLDPARISTIFLTGGTTAIPAVRQALLDIVPDATVVDGDRFGSVGIGLALEAGRRFG